MATTFGLAGYVGGTVKRGTKATAAPFHLTPKVKAAPVAIMVVGNGLVVVRG